MGRSGPTHARRALTIVAGGAAALVALALLALLAAMLALAPSPAVEEHREVRFADVRHVIEIARAHDPRRSPAGVVNAVGISAQEVDLLLNHAAHRWLGGRVDVEIERGTLRLRASTPLPPGRWAELAGVAAKVGVDRRWLNIDMRWRETPGLPALDGLRIGRLPLPAWAARPLLNAAMAAWAPGNQAPLLIEGVVQHVRLLPGALSVVYAWQPGAGSKLLSTLTPQADRDRLRAYADRLVAITERAVEGTDLPLPDLVAPLFELARQRSADGDAAAENRAAILTLAGYATGRGLGRVVPEARDWPQPRALQVTLHGRGDYPQHFLVSAAIMAEGTSPLAAAVGVYKEVADANGGSGFSFDDMAANRAGTRFGELAVREPVRLQAMLSRGLAESGLMPDVAGLPVFMSAAEFTQRFGGVGAPRYQRMLADIERRVGALPLYR